MWNPANIADKLADVFDPPAEPRFALVWLHSSAEEAPSDALTALLRKHNLACVAPHGGPSWWVDRVCPEFDPELTAERHLLDNVLPWAEGKWRRPVALAGIEMGGQGAVRFGLKHPQKVRVVGSLNGAFDFHELYGRGTSLDAMYDTRERCRYDTATLNVDPHHWPPHIYFACDPASPWHRGSDRLHEKLRAYGVPHTADVETGGSLDAVLAFLVNGLERESRRLM
jgi:S-formylglutathione hydrolase FrmB